MPQNEDTGPREEESATAGCVGAPVLGGAASHDEASADNGTTEAATIVKTVFEDKQSSSPTADDGYCARVNLTGLGKHLTGTLPIGSVDQAIRVSEALDKHRASIAGQRFGYVFLAAALIVLLLGLILKWVLAVPTVLILVVFGGLLLFGQTKTIGKIGRRLPFLKRSKPKPRGLGNG